MVSAFDSEQTVWVQALAGDIVFCSWARQFTLTVPLSTQVYKLVLANYWENLANCREVTCDGIVNIILSSLMELKFCVEELPKKGNVDLSCLKMRY